MNRSTAKWTTAIAAAALLTVPIASQAQQTTPARPSSPAASQPAATADMSPAQEHLRQAKTALNDVPAASLTGTAKSRVAELKRHISTLEQAAAKATAGTAAQKGKANWSTEVAAADRILNELLATEPAATGTTGSATAAKGAKSAAVTLDDTARAKLQEVRTHLTAFAAAMSGTAASSAPAPSSDPAASASAPAASAASAPAASAAPRDPAPAPTPTEPAAAAPPAAASPSPSASPAAQQPATPSAPPAAQEPDTGAVRRHLTAARDTLSQMTQLPAAAQLTGDARTQVSQLITNFNELITTNAEWRSSYAKVQANLNALVGDQRADESPAAPAAGQAGAVGTSGTVTLDPAIRSKLVEFRTHLMEFEKAAGGGSSASPAAPPSEPAPSPSAAATPAASPDAPSPAASAPSSPAPTAASSPAPAASAEPTPTGATGSSATPTATAGTSGSNPAPREDPQAASQPGGQKQAMHADAMRHLDAIEAILNGTSAAGTTGSANPADAKPSAKAPTSLDKAQIEQIRTHIAALRRAMNESNK